MNLIVENQLVTLTDLRAAWQDSVSVSLGDDARRRIAEAHELVDDIVAHGDTVYGVNTGFGQMRKDVGAEIRMKLNSFYLLPTAVFFSGTYGLDEFDFLLDEGFVTPDGSDTVRYGSEFQWHFGVLFGFDL